MYKNLIDKALSFGANQVTFLKLQLVRDSVDNFVYAQLSL